MCSSTCFLWFFLSLDCPVNDEKREKNPTRWKRWTIALLGTRSTNKEYSEKVALRRNRSRSRRYQQQESSLLTRASSALHSRTPIRSCESARFPSFVVFCYAVDNGGKKIWADEFMRKKPNQSTFFAKTYDYTRAHFCSPHFVRRRWRPQKIHVRMRDNENNRNKYVTREGFFALSFLDDDDALVEF